MGFTNQVRSLHFILSFPGSWQRGEHHNGFVFCKAPSLLLKGEEASGREGPARRLLGAPGEHTQRAWLMWSGHLPTYPTHSTMSKVATGGDLSSLTSLTTLTV